MRQSKKTVPQESMKKHSSSLLKFFMAFIFILIFILHYFFLFFILFLVIFFLLFLILFFFYFQILICFVFLLLPVFLFFLFFTLLLSFGFQYFDETFLSDKQLTFFFAFSDLFQFFYKIFDLSFQRFKSQLNNLPRQRYPRPLELLLLPLHHFLQVLFGPTQKGEFFLFFVLIFSEEVKNLFCQVVHLFLDHFHDLLLVLFNNLCQLLLLFWHDFTQFLQIVGKSPSPGVDLLPGLLILNRKQPILP